MIDVGVKELTGESSTADAWGSLVPDYAPGDKVAIKVNINNNGTDNYIDALPHPVNGIIVGLMSTGVLENDIYVMEPSRVFPTKIGDPILGLYSDVLIWDTWWGGTYGHKVSYSSTDPSLTVTHAHPDLSDSKLPDQMADVKYLINIPIIKGHPGGAGITLTFKNNFGFLKEISKLHPYCYIENPDYSYDMNPLHDIYLNSHIRDKTILIIGDAIFGHRFSNTGIPEVWNTFDGEFPKSIFVSNDPVAIDSVMFDFSTAEFTKPIEAQEYLHRAVELGLGTHDHWDNPIDKQYALIDFIQRDLSSTGRLDVDRIIKDHKDNNATEQDVKDTISDYMTQP
jgi:hypothetical protein